jgi:hypothetical protein
MKRERLAWSLGWVGLGIGLTELAIPKGLCRVLGAPRRYSWLVRALGIRELASGVGLLIEPQRRRWAWARVAGDAMDLALLAVTIGIPRANRAWQGAITAAVAGATLVDLYAAATKRGAPMLAGAVTPSLGMEEGSHAPLETWRGSGLAEDVGAPRHPSEEGEPDEVKQRMMREAERELGLPET